MIDEIFGNSSIAVQKLKNSQADCNLFLNRSSDLDVCEYYRGKTKPFNFEEEKSICVLKLEVIPANLGTRMILKEYASF